MTLMIIQPVIAPPLYYAVQDIVTALDKLPELKTLGGYATKLYEYILSRHHRAVASHLSNDIYSEESLIISTKQYDKKLQMQPYKFVVNYPADQKMPAGNAWRLFLSKPGHKQQLQQFLLNEWQSHEYNSNYGYSLL